jgi:telomerase reverse transcriptase
VGGGGFSVVGIRYADYLGYAVFDNYQIFDRYSTFKQKWADMNKPNIYYSTMDIQKCYDSVDLDLLFDLLKKENIFKNFYLISEFYKVMRNRRYVFRVKKDKSKGDKFKMSSLFIFKQRNSAIPLKEAGDLNNVVQDEPTKEGFTIFVDRPRKRLVSKEDLMDSIRFVCYQVRIKFGNQIYRLKKGLPQGLSISSVLSSFYYAVLEQKFLDTIYEGKRLGEHELIMRLTDDYLILCKNVNTIRTILEKLFECAAASNFTFNQKKLTTNFQFRDYNPEEKERERLERGEPKENKCKWIGKVVELDTLEIEHVQILDYRQLYYTISTNITYLDKFPAQIIKSKLKSFILNHNLFYVDMRVNSYPKIKEILRKTIVAAYLKVRTYLGKILGNTLTGHERWIALKITESLIDCSIAVHRIMDPLGHLKPVDNEWTKDIYKLFIDTFLACLHQDKTSKSKKALYHILKTKIKEAEYDYWVNSRSDTFKLVL